MIELPNGWAWTTLGKVASTQLGRMLSANRETGAHARPYLRNRDVQWGQINTKALPKMDFDGADRDRFLLCIGDILVCEGGEVGRAAIWRGALEECYFQKALHRVRVEEGVSNTFVRYLLEHYAIGNAFERFTTGTTIAHLPQEDLRLLPIPLPPQSEQVRIVSAIEEEFSRVDVGVAALTAARARIQSFSKVLLLSAVPEVPPPSWKITTVGDAGEVTLGRQRSPKFHRGANMRSYLRVANVFEDRIDTSSVMTMHFSEEEFAKYRLEPNDILLNEGQSPHLLGRPAMYRGDPPEVAFTNTLLRFRPRGGVLPEWALLVFRRHLHAKRFMRESQITTNIAHLSAGRFKAIEFHVPPLDEQRRISAEFAVQSSLLSTVALAVSQELTRSSALRASVLRIAFSGKLVPQDPKDEPASALLDRTAARRGDSTGTKSRSVRGSRAEVIA